LEGSGGREPLLYCKGGWTGSDKEVKKRSVGRNEKKQTSKGSQGSLPKGLKSFLAFNPERGLNPRTEGGQDHMQKRNSRKLEKGVLKN